MQTDDLVRAFAAELERRQSGFNVLSEGHVVLLAAWLPAERGAGQPHQQRQEALARQLRQEALARQLQREEQQRVLHESLLRQSPVLLHPPQLQAQLQPQQPLQGVLPRQLQQAEQQQDQQDAILPQQALQQAPKPASSAAPVVGRPQPQSSGAQPGGGSSRGAAAASAPQRTSALTPREVSSRAHALRGDLRARALHAQAPGACFRRNADLPACGTMARQTPAQRISEQPSGGEPPPPKRPRLSSFESPEGGSRAGSEQDSETTTSASAPVAVPVATMAPPARPPVVGTPHRGVHSPKRIWEAVRRHTSLSVAPASSSASPETASVALRNSTASGRRAAVAASRPATAARKSASLRGQKVPSVIDLTGCDLSE